MEENLDFLGRDAMPSNIPQVDAMDVPDFGYAGQVINTVIPSDLTTFGIDDVKYYSGNSVNKTLNDQDTAQKLFENAVITGSNPNPEISGYSNPSDYNKNQVSYDRYYNHPKFKNLGFSPFRDNESLYNQNATWGDEYSRMFGQFGKLFTTGFTSTFESLGDVISGNPAKLFDESAGAYSKAAEIGMTSKGGVLGFANNLVLNSGYTIGILSEIALEELALGALTVGTGGAGGALAAGRTAQNLGKLSRIGEMFSATRNFVKGLDKAGEARRFWKSAGDFLNPFENTVEAYSAIKKLNTGKNAVYRLDNAAKASMYFGGFYRDIRNMNAALAESKLEGGMVRDEVYKDLMEDYRERNNFTLPEGPEHEAILDQAQKAGFETEMKNLPLIYFSNKLAFDNILNGYKPLQKVLRENSGIVGDALRKTTVKGVPQYVRKKLTDVFTLPFTDPKAALKNVLGTGARYSMTNLTEGFQELAQETISDAYKNFYIESFKDPSLVHKNYMSTSLSEAINRQVFSSQGLETFMSGFLMGGVAGPFGKFMYKTLPAAGKYLTDKEGYKQYKAEKEKIITDTQQKLNEALKNPFKVFTTTDESIATQKALQKRMEEAAAKGEQLEYQDAKDEALFSLVNSDLEKSKQLRALAETGELDTLREHIEKLSELSDEEFKQAYGFSAEEKGKKVQETLDRIDSLKNASEEIEEMFGGNPFRPELYKPNSAQFINEMQQYKSWEAAKSHLLYQMYAQNRAVERKATLLESAVATPLFQGMAASDFNIMFDPRTLDAEVDLLAEEIKNMGEVTDPALKKQLEFKKKKESLLRSYRETYETNLKKDGTYDMRKVNRMYKVFRDYVDLVKETTSPKDIIKDASVQEVFSKLFDYKVLDARQQILEQSVNILMDPNYFKQLADRLSKVTTDTFNKVKEDLNTVLADHMDLLEKNDVIASLKEMGVLVDPDEALEYIKKGTIPKTFYHESVMGPVSTSDPIFGPIAQLFAIKQAKDAAEKSQSEPKQAPKDPKQKGQDPDDFAELEEDPVDEDVSAFTMAVINRLYEEYVASVPEVETIETKEEFFGRKKIQDIVKAIAELEKAYNDLTTEKGEFEEWLSDHKLSDKVQNILLKYNLTFNDIFKRVSDPNSFNNSTLGEGEKIASPAYKGVFVLSMPTEEGEIIYAVVDSQNNVIEGVKIPNNEEKNIKVLAGPYFPDLNAAIEVQKIIGDYLESTKQEFNFDGLTFKNGEVINDGNNDYIVITKPEDIANDPTTLNIKNIKTGSLVPLKSFSGFSKGARSTFDKSSLPSKFNTLNPINKMWGARLENETQQEANKRLNELLINTPFKELVQGLGIRFSKTGNSLERYSYLQLDDQKINYNFGFFKDPYSIEVTFGGETIGYLPNPTSSAFLDSQGNPINVNKLSVDKFKQAFYTKGSYVKMLEQYQASYRNKLALLDYLKNKLSDKESVEVPFSELSKFAKVNLLSGEYDFLPSNTPGTKFSDLNFYTVDGGIYIINREKKYQKGIMTDVEALPITDLDSQKADALTKEINDLRFAEGVKDPLLNYGRYVAVVRLPNGKLRFVELTTQQFTELQQEEFAKNISERIAKTKAENVNEKGESIEMEYNDVWNKTNISDKLFISLPLSKKGQFISFTVTPRGGIQIEFLNKNKTRKGIVLQRTFYIDNPEITSFNDLLIALNNGIKKHDENPKVTQENKINIVLSKDNFKQALAKNAGVEEFLELETSVGPNVVKNVSLAIVPEEQPSDVEVDPLNLPKDPDEPFIPGDIDVSSVPPGINAPTPDLLRGTASGNQKKNTPDVNEEDPIAKVQRRQREAQEALDKADAKEKIDLNIFDQVKELKDQIDDEIDRVRKELLSQAGDNPTAAQKKEIRKQAENAPSVKALEEQLKNLEKKLPFKVVEAGYTPSDIANINDFVTWVKNNLPDFITVEDLNTIANNIINQGSTVGAFVQGFRNIAGKVEVNGTIYVGADTPFKYHEAFHSVFRLLLSDAQITRYLAIAKKEVRESLRKQGKTLGQALQEMRELHPMYMRMSQSDLEARFYEEYLADKFDEWKMNKKTETSHVNKSLFAKIIEFIKKILGIYGKNELRTLFESIDAGKFRNTKVADNRFTSVDNPSDVSQPVLKAIKIGDEMIQDTIFTPDGEVKGIKVPKYLPEEEGTRLTAAIANQFVSALEKAPVNTSQDDILDEILDKYEELYDEDRDEYADLSTKEIKKVKDYQRIFSRTENREIIKESVLDHLSFISKKYNSELEADEELVDELGDRGKQNYTDGAENQGGFSSLSKYLRSWIATVSYQSEDKFGNKFFLDGTPYIEAVNASRVYAGILKAVSNTDTTQDMLVKLNLFKDQSPEAGKVITKFFEETNVTFDEEGLPVLDDVVNVYLFQSFIKGFGQYSYKYSFLNKDIFAEEVDIIEANRKSPGKVQMELWSSAFTDLYSNKVENNPDVKNKALGAIRDISSAMSASKKYTDDELIEKSSMLAKNLAEALGIAVSPLYLSYSIAASISTRTPKQDTLFSAYSNVQPITIETLNELYKIINDNEDPFINTIIEEQAGEDNEVVEVEVFRGGVTTRLEKVATANAIFDESVMPAVWTNAEGKTVYAHQLPSYHAVKLLRLQKDQGLDKELENDEFLRSNPVITSSRFRSVLRNLTIGRIDGQKVSTLTKTENGLIENKQLEKNKRDGITYGSYSPAEFITTLIDLYQKGTIVLDEEQQKNFATSTHLVRVLEASSTGNIIEGMPVIKSVEVVDESGKFKITDNARNILFDLVKQEYDRISRVQAEIISGEPISEKHFGYNVPDNKGNIRGLKLHKMGSMLTESLREELEQQAKDQKPITEKQKLQIKNDISNTLTNEVSTLYQILQDENIIQLNEDGKISRSAISKFLNKGFSTTVNKKDKADTKKNSLFNIASDNPLFNLAQLYINDFINTTSINQLMHGDHALSFKDGVDEVKRAKADNASGQSAASDVKDTSRGIMHKFDKMHVVTFEDPTIYGKYKKGKVEVADGQTWLTAKALRYILNGFGKLSPKQAELLDKIDRGERITGTEFFGDKDKKGYVSFDAVTNSIKIVYADGKRYIKTSAVVLTKEFTSYGEGFNKALPGREELHELRQKLEAYESVEGRNTVGMAIPVSASKMQKTNVASSISEITDENFIQFDPNFLRLQQENPSNKIKITDPTQIKQILMAEQDDNTLVNFMGKEITVAELKEIYQKTAIARVTSNYLFKRNEIFTLQDALNEVKKSVDRNKVTPKLEVFQKYAVERLKESAADAQMIEFFEVGEDGMPKYNLNNPLTMDKFAQLFLAYFSKGVLSEKVPGHSAALISSFGNKKLKKVLELDEEGQPKRWEIVRDDEFKLNPEKYGTPKKFVDEPNRLFRDLQEGDYYIDDLRHNVPEYDKDGNITGYFTEFVMPAHFKEVYDNIRPGDIIPDVIAKSFGVRIPSQDKHSAVNLKLVDFMPVYYGSSAVFAPELIEISGADFDIDKLYITIKEFYTQKKNGKVEFVAYGTGKTDQEKFNQYVKYQFLKNKNFRKAYSDFLKAETERKEQFEEELNLLDVDQDFDDALDYFDLNDSQLEYFIDKKELVKSALEFVNLPSTKEQYSKNVEELGYEPYQGALNNTIVDARMALFGNKNMVTTAEGETIPKAFQVASTRALEEVVENFKKEFSEALKDQLDEGKYNVDTLLGKYYAFKNNKEGARNIGPAVNSLLVYTLLNQNNIKVRENISTEERQEIFRFRFNGNEFNDYGQTRAYVSATGRYNGDRIMDTISTLISAMTDNAKERLAAKLNLNINSLGIVANMIAQGVPLRDSLLFINQPIIREYYKRLAKEKSSYSFTEFTASKLNIIDGLKEQFDGENLSGRLDTLTLEQNMNEPSVQVNNAILDDFKMLMKQSESFLNIAAIMKVNKGLPTNLNDFDEIMEKAENLGYGLNDKTFESSSIPLDVREVLDDQSQTVGANFRIYQEISSLTSTIMLQRTPVVKSLKRIIEDNFNVNFKDRDTFNSAFDKNIVSYFAIKAYINFLKNNQSGRALASLNNGMIYDETESQLPDNMDSVVDIVNKIREVAPKNYFAKNFIFAHNAAQLSNRDNINKVTANTWAKLNKLQVNKLQYSLMELYTDPLTRAYVVDIFHYLLVKDGGQFKSDSFIRVMPNFIFENILEQAGNAVKYLMQEKPNDLFIKSTFGASLNEMFNEFVTGYLSNSSNSFYIRKYNNLNKKVIDRIIEGIEGFDKIKDPKQIPVISPVTYVPKTDSTTADTVEIKMFKNVEFTSDYVVTGRVSEIFDETTGKYTTVDEIEDIPGTTKMTEKGKASFIFNLRYLRAFGLDTSRVDNKEGIGFPLVIKRSTKDEIKGTITSYYRLSKIKRNRKFVQADPGLLLNPGDSYAYGTEAVYEKIDLQGSYKQFAAGFVIPGYLPTAKELSEKKKALRKAANNKGGFNLDASVEAAVSQLDIDAAISQLDSIGFKPQDLKAAERNSGEASIDYNLELSKLGIDVSYTNGKITYTKEGKPYNAMGATSPKALFERLSSKNKPDENSGDPDFDYSEDQGPSFEFADTVVDNRPVDIPAIDFSLIAETKAQFPGLADFYYNLTEEQLNKIKSEYNIKNFVDLTDQFILSQSESGQSEKGFIDQIKNCYL